MKALSLMQPFASLWLTGPKLHETRQFRTSHRGWLLVHASKTLQRPTKEVAAICARLWGDEWFKTLPRGALLGAVLLQDCEPSGMTRKRVLYEDLLCSDFTPGRWAWRRHEKTVVYEQPIEYRGMPGLFTVPDALVAERMREMRA